MNDNKKRDFLTAALFIAVALVILLLAIPLGVQEPKKVKFVALSPSYYPRLVSLCLLGFGLLLLTTRLFSKSSRKNSSAGNGFNAINAILIACILGCYYISLPILGFVVSSAVVLLILLLMAGERSPWFLVTLPVALPFGLYFFFTKVANIPIPAGILEPLLVGT